MKQRVLVPCLLAIAFFLILGGGSARAAVILTGFGSDDSFTEAGYSTMVYSIQPTFTTISGATTDQFGGFFVPTSIVGQSDILTLTATFTLVVNPGGLMSLTIVDGTYKSKIYQAPLESFVFNTPTTVNFNLTSTDPGFDETNVVGVDVSFGSIGTVAMTLDHLTASAIPEPGTWALLAVGGVMVFLFRSRARRV